MTPIDDLKSVLCGPDGKCCITGSASDRKIVDNALDAMDAQALRIGELEKNAEADAFLIALANDNAVRLLAERDTLRTELEHTELREAKLKKEFNRVAAELDALRVQEPVELAIIREGSVMDGRLFKDFRLIYTNDCPLNFYTAPVAPAQPAQEPDTAIQWRNINKVVRAAADLCFGSKDDPKYGHCWLAIVQCLTAKDGLDILALKLEPLAAPVAPAQPQDVNAELVTALSMVLTLVRRNAPNLSGKVLGYADTALANAKAAQQKGQS